MENLLNRLNLKTHVEASGFKTLKVANVLQIKLPLQSNESCAEGVLVQIFLQKLLIINYRARYLKTIETKKQNQKQQEGTDDYKDMGDIYNNIFECNEETSQTNQIHPMDVQMAVFHCADVFLKQLMVTKLSQCQFALPLLVSDTFTQQIKFPLWTFRQIHKSWRIRNNNKESLSQTQPIYKTETPMVFFFRFGSVSSSKSQLMNSLINERHNTFFHRNCPGSSRTRVLMDGVVEIAWFCPSGRNYDKFTDCVAFCNLHGDAGDHEKQLKMLTEMASVNVVLLPQLQRNDKRMMNVQKLYKDSKPLICLMDEDVSTITKIKKSNYKIGLKDRNESDISEELRQAINDCLSESSSTFKLEDVSKHPDIRVDEEDDEDCRRGREAAQQMMSLLEKKKLTEIKESFLPHQGKLWHQWSQKNRELHRLLKDRQTETKIKKMKNIRKQQHKSDISKLIEFFIKEITPHAENKMCFFKWLRIFLDEYTSADLSTLHQKYNKQWSIINTLKKNLDPSGQIKVEQVNLEIISEDLQAATFGVEHIMREIGQIYESCESVNENKKDLQVHFSSLPSLAAQMMISGFPLELMDGDAAHVPVVWISAVLDQLVHKLGDQTRVFVLSVLGLQSSGKSTMLNAMFGLQFPVSAGRCTRGAFMQLVKVSDEMKTQMNFDFILVVDTEGLGAPELAGRSTRHHDNELATFIVGLANLILINIFGENLAEMQDILQTIIQAFMRMKKVRLNPSCVFVHQSIPDVTAKEKNMEGRRQLQKKLDEMTKLTAEEEVFNAEHFSDVIRFDIQRDVKYIAQLWEGSPPMAPPNPDYCENIQELKETIISYASKLISEEVNLENFKDRVEKLWKAVLEEHFTFSFKNSEEISAYRKLETENRKWTWSLRRAMMETENKLHKQIENEVIHEVKEINLDRELKSASEEVEKSMSEFFEKDQQKDTLIQWKITFEIKIKHVQEKLLRETKRRLNEILKQRDLKKRIDAQHKNMLYEKSKELALNPIENDEQTLKKEFDLLWDEILNKVIKDTPVIRDIDFMRDVREILSDNENVSVDHCKEVNHYNDIIDLQNYSKYLIFKKSPKRQIKKLMKCIGFGGCAQIPDDQTQIKSFVTDVVQQTEIIIQSLKISKMGYNISCLQQLKDYIKNRISEYLEGPVKYEFRNTFFIDLAYSVCKRSNSLITEQHRLFREANDPVLYLEKKRVEYYSIFQKYCQGSTSAVIFGEILCQKLKEPIEQSVYRKTSRDLADEMRSNCESLNGNRLNLEKHILRTLAEEEEDFNKYMNYIHNPRDHFKSFIRDEVSQYIRDKFSVSVLPKMEENIELLQQKILTAAHESTEHVQLNSGDVHLWLKSFTQCLSHELIFSERHLSGVKYDDVYDFKLLDVVVRRKLSGLMSDVDSRFSSKTFLSKLDFKFRPDELLIDHLCQCCWVQCPFCGAICTNTIENHDGDHSVPFHRSVGLNGIYYGNTSNLSNYFCTSAVANNNLSFCPTDSDDEVPFKEYRRAGGVFAKWSITPDLSELPYWKLVVCRFQKDLEKYYSKTFDGYGKIPDEWRKYSKQDVFETLDKYL